MFDTVISNGQVIDGTGAPGFMSDVGIVGDRIVALGNLAGAQSREKIDATGRTVAPGFIDMHTHSDFTLLVDGRADSQICQGVTTEAIGQCGFSCAPLGPCSANHQISGYIDAGVDVNWKTFGGYLDKLEEARPAVNVAAFVGHGTLHGTVKGHDLSPTTVGDIADMVRLAEEAFDQGAIGLSTGLEYFPGNIAPLEEVAAMAAVAARRGGLYATHVRNRDIYYDLGFTEAIATARHAGARLQISHIQPKFGAPPHAMQHSLELLYRAEREGVDIGFDVIPHDWAHTKMVAGLPAWAREGGWEKTIERLKDKNTRVLMTQHSQPHWRIVKARQWSDIVLLRAVENKALVGQSFEAIGRQRGVDPYDAYFDILIEEGVNMPHALWTSHSFSDSDIRMCLKEAMCSVMSDTLALTERGPLKGQIGSLSGYGWTARFLGHYVRDHNVVSLEEAINQITLRPAQRLGIKDRGRLRAGAYADIVVFDSEEVLDQISVLSPHKHPTGFEHVLVNGRFAMRDGKRNDEQSGHVLRG